ncbi:MAG: YHYH protein [Rhodobacteraceae bacterium]|nr:YHYH protein [Paracoccaceae bacterium]
MMSLDTLKTGALCLSIALGCALSADAQGRPPMRVHTATQSQPLALVPANREVRGGRVEVRETARKIEIEANGVPNHTVGVFPNAGNPHSISAQSIDFTVPKTPRVTGKTTDLGLNLYFGVALNGVPFDPGAAEFWQGNPRSGWNYDALGGAVSLGLDANYAHVQPNGSYHYHGLPTGFFKALGWSDTTPSPLIGYAADGFPIYLRTALVDGKVRDMQSSYQLKSGSRPGGNDPGGRYDGTFVEDYVFVEGSGDLDACNGAVITNSAYADGTYAYFLTEAFPTIPRCLNGKPDKSFYKRR